MYTSNGVRKSYRFTACRRYKPTEGTCIAQRLAWVVKGRLSHRMISRVEVEFNFITSGNCESIRIESETIFAHVNGLNCS